MYVKGSLVAPLFLLAIAKIVIIEHLKFEMLC